MADDTHRKTGRTIITAGATPLPASSHAKAGCAERRDVFRRCHREVAAGLGTGRKDVLIETSRETQDPHVSYSSRYRPGVMRRFGQPVSALMGLALLGACANMRETPPTAAAPEVAAGPAERACVEQRVSLGGPGAAEVKVEETEASKAGRLVTLRDADGQGFRCVATADGEIRDFAAIIPGTLPPTGADTPEEACLQSVVAVSGEDRASLLESQFSEAGTLVRVGVGQTMTPWRCIAYRDGSTAGIEAEPVAEADGRLKGTEAEFDAMTEPCLDQAARFGGVPRDATAVTGRIRTGSGPLLTLLAGDAKLSCRLEADDTVTVFSEFAN